MIQSFINRYRQKQKAKYLSQSSLQGNSFAFVGVGMHSIQNLYPALMHIGVGLRWIHSRTLRNAEAMASRFPGAKGTNDIENLLRDAEVKGIFLCANAGLQHALALQCIQAGKHVWIEKPVAKNAAGLTSLIQAAESKNIIAVAGHQRRFAPCYLKLKQEMKNPLSYSYAYNVGAFPEGDVLSEIFIHPIDLVQFLFGEADEVQVQRTGNVDAPTFLCLLSHRNGVKGILEMSAHGSWSQAGETLRVDTKNGIYASENFRSLTFTAHSSKILGVPMEKIRNTPLSSEILFSANGFLPQLSQNEIVLAGFYDSLRTFAESVNGNASPGAAELNNLKGTFAMMDVIRSKS
jgi:virulence factor